VEASSEDGWKESLISYVLEHGDSLDFTRHFWKGCEPIENDIIQYWKFSSAMRLVDQGYNNKEIAVLAKASASTIYTWRNLCQLPKIAHYLRVYLKLGAPREGFRWLTTECSHGYGIPVGRFLTVPLEIRRWQEVADVLSQLQDLNDQPTEHPRDYLLGFLVGIMMGDAAKSRSASGSSHRHIGFVLSKKYETNLMIGDFTALCARSVGLRMHRTEDLAKPAIKPNGFYEWVSQASPFVDWMYNVLLGLRDDELTTYDSVRADWMLLAPRDFRIGLIQGIAESDGSVSVASQIVEFWVDPHRDLLKKLLAMEGLHAFNNRQALSLSKIQAIKSFAVPIFNPQLRTVRYRRHEIMATARRLTRFERLSDDLRSSIMTMSAQGLSTPEIIEKIAEERKILISFEAGQRWARKARSANAEAYGLEDGENHRNY
jgi:hypothetical protein